MDGALQDNVPSREARPATPACQITEVGEILSAREKEESLSLPAEPTQAEQKTTERPRRQNGGSPRDFGEGRPFEHDFAQGVVELGQRQRLDDRLHNVRKPLRRKEG